MTKWIMTDYWDVWGNEEDGWEVNDVMNYDLNLKKNPSNKEIFEALYNMEHPRIQYMSELQFDWTSDERCEISRIDNGLPICAIVKEV